MTDIILTNACLVQPGQKNWIIDNGVLGISNGRLLFIDEKIPDRYSDYQVIDLQGQLILPGMINAHTHLYSALAPGMPAPKRVPQNFVEILQSVWWKLDRALDAFSVRASFEAGLLDCLRSGVTTVIDHHSSPNYTEGSLSVLAEIAEKFGVKISAAFEITDRNGEDRFNQGLEENLAFLRQFRNHPHIRPLMGLHASFTLSDESLRTIRSALETESGWGIHIHVAEDAADEADARQRGYRSVIDRLQKFDLLNDHSLVIHGLHVTSKDIDVISQSGAMLVHNPTSNANNRVGMLSGEIIEELHPGLGTDGMQANMLQEAKEGTLIRSHTLPGGAENVDYLSLLFDQNPRIAETIFGYPMGRLEVGQPADLAIYDYHPRTDLNAENIGAHLLFGLKNPSTVMCDGEFIIKNRKFISIDEDEILNTAQKQSKKLWTTMHE